jgi:hypothetical protein
MRLRGYRFPFPLRPEFMAWARRFRAAARRDEGMRTFLASAPQDDPCAVHDVKGLEFTLADVIASVEMAMFASTLDQREPDELLRFLHAQVYDAADATTRYAVHFGSEALRYGRIYVDRLTDVSLVELVWHYTTDFGWETRIEVQRQDRKHMTRRECAQLKKDLRADIAFDLGKDEYSLEFEPDDDVLTAVMVWNGIGRSIQSLPMPVMRLFMAAARMREEARTRRR